MHMFSNIAVALSIGTFCVSGAAIEREADILSLATNKQVLHIGEHVINIETIPAPESRLASIINTTARSPIPETSLTKRATVNCCPFGTLPLCVDGLSDSPDPPTLDDCTALQSALQQLSQQLAQASQPPCNVVGNFNCPNFVVSPGFERTFSLGTCLIGFINLNPTGGADQSYCDFLLAGTLLHSYADCITPGNSTGTLDVPNGGFGPGSLFGVELRHI